MPPTKRKFRAFPAAGSQIGIDGILPPPGKGSSRRLSAPAGNNIDGNKENIQIRSKSKIPKLPMPNDKIKRTALGNLTNKAKLHSNDEEQKQKQLPKKATKEQRNALLDAENLIVFFSNKPMPMPYAMAGLKWSLVDPAVDMEDFGCRTFNDWFQVSFSARDMFNYLKRTEPRQSVHDYMPQQIHLTRMMRSGLINWMILVQLKLQLKPETPYLAVRLVDLYLSQKLIGKEKFQLLVFAAFLIAWKYQNYQLNLIKEFVKIGAGWHNRDELIQMELGILCTIRNGLGMPLSYTYLQLCAGVVHETTLILAQYILELSLTDYEMIGCSGSQLASAALFMALRMHGGNKNLNQLTWTTKLVDYTGYKLADFAGIVPLLNAILHKQPQSKVMATHMKFSAMTSYDVTKVPLLSNQEMFLHNLDLNDIKLNKLSKTPLLEADENFGKRNVFTPEASATWQPVQLPMIKLPPSAATAFKPMRLIFNDSNSTQKSSTCNSMCLQLDFSIPPSYSFLSQCASCAQVKMSTLNLARYILELSLVDCATIECSDSQLASAALFVALRMHGGIANLTKQAWTTTLVNHTGHQLAEFAEIVPVLNATLHGKSSAKTMATRMKFSQKSFYEVAKVPLLSNQEIFPYNIDLNNSI
ncbi:GH13591 [Drosophila grimshawi]|uniref:GH13591 n=1 Tax=Drosophila grimshawi TaxID=7222 RepID=B4JPV3_DROGR|nr:GH13591 [Drosophila grimshawi]